MLDAAHGEAVRTVVAVHRIRAIRIELQIARIATAGRSRRGRPALAVRADIVQGSRLTVAVARCSYSRQSLE